MLAVRYYGPRDIRTEKIEKPSCGPDQVLVRVAYAGICGSDMHNYRKGMFMTYAPETMGHEFSGVVCEVGRNVKGWKEGMHVIGDPRVYCGKCTWCAQGLTNLCPDLGFIGEVSPGSFASYIIMDPNKLLPISRHVPLEEAALAEPLAVAIHIARLGQFQQLYPKEDIVGIIGAGPIGLLTLMLAREIYKIKTQIVDISSERLKLAKEIGAECCLQEITSANENKVSLSVEAVGKGITLEKAMLWVKPRGKLVMAGLYEDECILDPNPIVTKEIKLIGINSYEKIDLYEAIDYLEKSLISVRPLITAILSASEAAEAFAMLDSDLKKAGKLLLKFDAE